MVNLIIPVQNLMLISLGSEDHYEVKLQYFGIGMFKICY